MILINKTLSCGQEEIIRLVMSNMDEHKKLKWGNPEYSAFCKKFIDALSSNSKITSDPIVSRPISMLNGFDLTLRNNSEIKNRSEIVSFIEQNKFSYSNIEICYYLFGHDEIKRWATYPLFSFGNKPDRIGILFDMLSKNEIKNIDLDLSFDVVNNQWRVGSGGCHRTIASILLNKITILPDSITLYSDNSL